MNTSTPVSLNRRWALALAQDSASTARDLTNLGLSPHDVIDGDQPVPGTDGTALRAKSLWRWAARASGYQALSALASGVEAQWAMRPDRRQTLFVSGFEQPMNQEPTQVVRLHNASPGLQKTRVDGWALDEALHWQDEHSVHKLVWLNQQMQTWAGTMAWDVNAPAPWGGSVGDRSTFLRQGWQHALLTAGDAGAWSLAALEHMGIVPEGAWDSPLRNADAGPSSTLLLEAARLAQPDLVRSLLDHGVDPNQTTPEGITPLGYLTAHIVQAPEQRMPELVAAWVELVESGASLDTLLPSTSTRPSVYYRANEGDWIETAPNNDWAGRSVSDTIQAWLAAQQRSRESAPLALGYEDNFRRTHVSIAMAGRVARVLEARELRQTWEASQFATRSGMQP